jgi:hypothetical protein
MCNSKTAISNLLLQRWFSKFMLLLIIGPVLLPGSCLYVINYNSAIETNPHPFLFGCLEHGFVCALGGWLRVMVGSVGFPLFGFEVVVVSAALFWAAASLLWSAAGAGYCSPALMRCLLGGSSWIK